VENVELASEGSPASLSAAELAVIGKVQEAYRSRTVVDCTACRYCMPCPQGINIPLVFSCLNNASLFDDLVGERISYNMDIQFGHTAPASACTQCGQCAEACPQQLDVTRELASVAEIFEQG
jgi:predicted aldo/keto reductase-like oxidoreductase